MKIGKKTREQKKRSDRLSEPLRFVRASPGSSRSSVIRFNPRTRDVIYIAQNIDTALKYDEWPRENWTTTSEVLTVNQDSEP